MLFQGKIYLENGIIKAKEKSDGFLEVFAFGKSIGRYENSSLVPKFFDSHGHILELGVKIKGLNLYDCTSKEECLNKIKSLNYITRGDWITGIGWNQEKWNKKEYPTKEDLDEIFPNTPVFILRADAHAAWVNSKAISIVKDNNLKLSINAIEQKEENSGIFFDNSMSVFKSVLPNFSQSQLEELILAAQESLLEKGIYSICEMDSNQEIIDTLISLDKKKLLKIKVYCYMKGQNFEWKNYTFHNTKNVKFVGIKLFADGALGSRGAFLFNHYADDITNLGLELLKIDDIYKRAEAALEDNLSIAIHSIGDRASYNALKAFSMLKKDGIGRNHLRIEHCQMLRECDIQLFSDNNIIASLQPIHCISDVPEMLNSRININNHKDCYRWNSLLNNGIRIIAGSDFPIEDHNPIKGINAFTKRKVLETNKTWFPEEIIPIEDAVDAFSVNPSLLLDDNYIENHFENFQIINNNTYQAD